MKKLGMRDWAVVPHDSEGLELALSTCTGVFAYQMGKGTSPKEGAPYLVTHNPALTVLGMNPNEDMLSAMSAEEFSGEGGKRICLAQILWEYRKEIGENARVGVYMANGLRAVHSDLAVARYFIASGAVRGDYELMGADLDIGEIVRAQFMPAERRIDVLRGLKTAPMFSYRMGERRPVNLGK